MCYWRLRPGGYIDPSMFQRVPPTQFQPAVRNKSQRKRICEAGSRNLCGIVAGLPGAASDAALARYRSELCGLPVIWDLKAGADERHWKNGKLLDPETERAHDLEAIIIGRNLELRVFEKGRQTFHRLNWTYVEIFKEPCK